MVDIHSHVLPGLDDGARTIDETLEMLRLAAASGTTDIVATPHANAEYVYDAEKVEAAFRQASDVSEGIIRLHLGCDFHLNYENVLDVLRYPTKYTINRARYLMVELPDLVALSTVRTGLEHLLSARIVPVITHPERNPSVQFNMREMQSWRKAGCFLQITAQSLLGRFGEAAQNSAEKLLRSGLADFVASDAHDSVDRPPDLSTAYRQVTSNHGSTLANRIFIDNPTAVLWGEPLHSERTNAPRGIRRLKSWLFT